jgi:hypothetical protein
MYFVHKEHLKIASLCARLSLKKDFKLTSSVGVENLKVSAEFEVMSAVTVKITGI